MSRPRAVLVLPAVIVLVAAGGLGLWARHAGEECRGAGEVVRIDGYAGDQLTNAQAIIGAATALGIDQHGQEIGVMTAMDESGLHDDDHGDLAGPDSRGLFQQRDTWGTLAQRMDPGQAATLFFQRMVQVPGWEGLPPTQVAHTVQVNADPDAYARYWQQSVDVVTGLAGKSVCTPPFGF